VEKQKKENRTRKGMSLKSYHPSSLPIRTKRGAEEGGEYGSQSHKKKKNGGGEEKKGGWGSSISPIFSHQGDIIGAKCVKRGKAGGGRNDRL